ncbi:MAG: hypothetical protein IJT88_06240 [Kiritimatiellae bacterium]|nr:hypothetical protein [Kiritimatiellia bacterium]
MIKKLVIALALAASVVAIAAPTFAALHSHKEDTQGNYVCNACNGTGRSYGSGGKGTGNYKCWQCKGTGFIGGY